MKLYEVTALVRGKQTIFNMDTANEYMARVAASNTFYCQVSDVEVVSVTSFDVVHLQGVGKVRAKAAVEFEPGEKMGFNAGYAYVVHKVVKETAKTITLKLVSLRGTSYERVFKKSQMVAIAEGDNWQ